jgi:hypothetical protein
MLLHPCQPAFAAQIEQHSKGQVPPGEHVQANELMAQKNTRKDADP